MHIKLGYSHATLRVDPAAVHFLRDFSLAHLEVRVDDVERSSLLFSESYQAELARIRADLGLTLSVHSFAGVNLAEKVPRVRQCCVDVFVEQMNFCHRVGAEWLTVHAGTCGFGAGDVRKQVRLSIAAEAMAEVLERTARTPVRIGIENVERLPAGLSKAYLGDCLLELNELYSALPGRTGFVFDAGHANLNPERDPASLLLELRKRLLSMHVHANDGLRDLHAALSAGWVEANRTLVEAMLRAGVQGCPLIVEHYSIESARKSVETLMAAASALA